MALSKGFIDQYGNTASYIKINSDPIQDHTAKTGCLKIFVWKDESARKSGKQHITEIEISVQDKNARIDNSGCIKTLRYVDCADKTRPELYALLKTRKISIHDQIVDLANAKDLL